MNEFNFRMLFKNALSLSLSLSVYAKGDILNRPENPKKKKKDKNKVKLVNNNKEINPKSKINKKHM